MSEELPPLPKHAQFFPGEELHYAESYAKTYASQCIATLKAENERAKQELAAYIADGLPEYQRLGKELRDRMEAALADARDKALEEAAQIADGINHQYTSSGGHAAERCAAAIRSLRTTSEK